MSRLAFAVVVGTALVFRVLLLRPLLGPIFGRVHLASLIRTGHRVTA